MGQEEPAEPTTRGKISDDLRRDMPILNAVREQMRAAVKPLFTNWDGPPRIIGTGVLLSFNEMVFIVTAAHVLQDFDGYALYLPVGTEITGVKGYSYRSPKPASGSHREDPIDAAAFYVDEGPLRDVLRKEALGIDDVFMTNELFENGVVLLGHPGRSFERRGKSVDTELTWVHLFGEDQSAYSRLGYSPDDHLLMKYSKRVMTPTGPGNVPSLKGMSGGGVWAVPSLMRRPWPRGTLHMRPRLAGIFIETRTRDRVYVATKIFSHLVLISRAHPELLALVEDELAKSAEDDKIRQSEEFQRRRKLSIELEYVIETDLDRWMVLHKPSKILMCVSRDRSSRHLAAHQCEVCLRPERLEFSSHEIERIKTKAIVRVAEHERDK